MIAAPDLSAPLRRYIDLFEIGFVFVFLPVVVSTMDQPPLHLGALLLLWLAAWFLIRAQAATPSALQAKWTAFKPVHRVLWLAGLALFGGAWGAFSFHGARSSLLAGASLVPLRALLFSLPLCVLAFEYAPRRFRGRGWIPAGALALLPALLFAAMHIATASWLACLAAFVGGWIVLRFRLPLWLCVASHAAVGWAGLAQGWW